MLSAFIGARLSASLQPQQPGVSKAYHIFIHLYARQYVASDCCSNFARPFYPRFQPCNALLILWEASDENLTVCCPFAKFDCFVITSSDRWQSWSSGG